MTTMDVMLSRIEDCDTPKQAIEKLVSYHSDFVPAAAAIMDKFRLSQEKVLPMMLPFFKAGPARSRFSFKKSKKGKFKFK